MKLLKYSNEQNFTLKCPICGEKSLVNIDFDNFNCILKCKNAHFLNNLSFNDFKKKCLKLNWALTNYCSKCSCEINKKLKNIICNKCNNLFCAKCYEKHSFETMHNTGNFFGDNYCKFHNLKKEFSCENSNDIYLCQKCIEFHKVHYIKSLDEYFIEFKEYNEKIKKLFENITKIKDEIIKRFYKIKSFFEFLTFINNIYLNKFDFSNFDNYDYKNIKYFFNLQKNANFFELKKYTNYITFGKHLNFEKGKTIKMPNNIINTNEEKDEKDLLFYDFNKFKNFEYLNSNIFFSFINDYKNSFKINIFELKKFSFNSITSYNYKDKKGKRAKRLKPGNYNYFFVIFDNLTMIHIFKYNDLKKKIELLFDINDSDKNYLDIINNKNYIIAVNPRGIQIFDINFLKLIKYINTAYLSEYNSLYNVGDHIFLAMNLNKICFYELKKYQIIKVIEIPVNINNNSLGNLSNKILVFADEYSNKFYLVDLKFLEIVQIIEYQKNSFNFLMNNGENLLKINLYEEKVEISKFNNRYGRFDNTQIIKIKAIENGRRIINIMTKNNMIIFYDYNKIEIYKLN